MKLLMMRMLMMSMKLVRVEVVDGAGMVHEVVDVTSVAKEKSKAKVGEKGKVKAKVGEKGKGKAKVGGKGKGKAAVESGSKRSRKQAKIIESSETESDYEMHGGMSSDSDDSLFVPNWNEEKDWSMEEDNNSYFSEELHSPVSSDEENNSGRRPRFPQHNAGAGFGHVHLEIGMEFPDLKSFKNVLKDFTIAQGRDIRWLKNEKYRDRAEGRAENCKWSIYC